MFGKRSAAFAKLAIITGAVSTVFVSNAWAHPGHAHPVTATADTAAGAFSLAHYLLEPEHALAGMMAVVAVLLIGFFVRKASENK